jgi:predicted nuclease with RNAse H fold
VNSKFKWAGIDYGSKLAGTTVICAVDDAMHCIFYASLKGSDADAFIKETIVKLDIPEVFLDAPLSLPGKYFGKGDSYFYRLADVELKAMSPMFLGGLTARAMQLKQDLDALNIKVHETYPSALVKELNFQHYSKKGDKNELALFLQNLHLQELSFDVSKITNWHHVDALLAAFSGYRFSNNEAKQIGNPAEGLIVF